MPLSPGTRLGAYEILSLIGSGGMGEVYRAHDTKLNRDVAIKVLPDTFAANIERLARFKREAQVLASLDHPNIGAIYGFEDSDGVHALVLQLVEGPTLADRIAQGPIPIDEALLAARQIADALEVAHEKGIIHRDLKPANIKITPDGIVKVLDFGLAKAAATDGSSPILSHSPTVTIDRTRDGVLLGTPAYMSPEQARGMPVDKRTDVWAFGSVLYEMLTGHAAFAGETVSDTIARIIEREPDWSRLPESTPPTVKRLLERCLTKDAKRRLRDIADARHELEAPFAERAPHIGFAHRLRRNTIVAGAALATLLIVAVALLMTGGDRRPALAVSRLSIPLSSADQLSLPGRQILAISPDGRRVVYAANRRLYLRALDQLEAVPISGTDPPSELPITLRGDQGRAQNPVFSPDAQWIAFTQNGQLKKVPASGGSASVVASAVREPFSVTWAANGTILFTDASVEGGRGGIWQVADAGGSSRLIVPIDKGGPITPQLLPGEPDILFTNSQLYRDADADIVVQSLKSQQRSVILHGGVSGRYLPSGHLIFGLRGTLYAVRFDVTTRRAIGPSTPVISDVAEDTAAGAWGGYLFAVSENGTLVYLPQSAVAIRRVPVWVDRQGHEEPFRTEPRAFEYPRISPDGQRIVFDMRDEQNDIWTWEMARSTLTRITFDRQSGGPAIWTRDGRYILTNIPANLFRQTSMGGGNPERLLTSANGQYAGAFSPDGHWLVFEEVDPATKFDLRLLSMDDGRVSVLLQTPFNEQNADISPDGRWLAYQSDESGRGEVYVRPFPNVSAGRWKVSTTGGTRPLWSRDGHELFYLDPDRRLIAVPVQTAPEFSAGISKTLFETRQFGLEGIGRNYDVSADGSRFLLIKNLPTPPDAKRLIVVENWTEELKQRVPTK